MKLEKYTINTLVEDISKTIVSKEKKIIANQNMHSLYLCMKDQFFFNFINKQSVHVDGMFLIFLANLFGYKLKRDNRIAYIDFLPELLKEAEIKGHRVFLFGGTKESNSIGIQKLRWKHPQLTIAGHDGFDHTDIINIINNFKPHILLVGFGMPIQEFWIKDNYNNINCNVFLPCGAIIDYISGKYRTPPRWLGRIGLEWLHRLIHNPKYLWKRYFLEPLYIFFNFHKLIQLFKLNKSS